MAKINKFNPVLKLLNSKLFTKLNIYPANLEKNIINGDVLLKKGKNRLTATFDYKDNQVIIKNGNLRNPFLYGQLNIGDINGDNDVNIIDVVILVNAVLDGDYSTSGDMNQDGVLDVLDIVTLVNTILN